MIELTHAQTRRRMRLDQRYITAVVEGVDERRVHLPDGYLPVRESYDDIAALIAAAQPPPLKRQAELDELNDYLRRCGLPSGSLRARVELLAAQSAAPARVIVNERAAILTKVAVLRRAVGAHRVRHLGDERSDFDDVVALVSQLADDIGGAISTLGRDWWKTYPALED